MLPDMRQSLVLAILTIFIVSGCKKNEPHTFDYPEIPNTSVVEEHYGIPYTNAFSNLEQINDSSIVQWFKAQDSITESYFDAIPQYREVYTYYDSLENKEKDPARRIFYNESGATFYLSRAKDKRNLLYRQEKGTGSQLLYDPKVYKDGTYDIAYYKPSYDGKYVAMAMEKEGHFFDELLILDCEAKKTIGEPIVNTKPRKAGGYVWAPDGKCISFIAYPNYGEDHNDRNSYTALYCLDNLDGTAKPIFKDGKNGVRLNQEYYPVPMFRSTQSNFMFIYAGNASDFWDSYFIPIEDYKAGRYSWKKLYSSEDMIFHDWGTERDGKYYFKRLHEDNIELCMVDLEDADFQHPKVLFSGKGEDQLSGFKVTRDNIYYTVSTNGIASLLYKYMENTEDVQIELPASAGEITFDYRSPYNNDLWVTLSGWTANPRDYYLDPETGKFEFVTLGMWPDFPEFSNIISEVVEVTSHDGTKIPLSIVRRKDHTFDKESMGIITAYGAYGISETPWFHSPIADFVNQGNIYASAHVRGGGEKGPKWHEAGMKSSKANSWKDLNACSQYLIDNGYIHPKRLGLTVSSAGGITGGMAVNERPDLYGVFTGFVPNLNVIRTEYMEGFDDSDTAFEFGTIKEKESYQDLLRMDPVVNLSKDKEYPSTLMIIGFNDYLIPPSGPGKYTALLQSYSKANDKPYLLDVKFDGEHEIDWVEDYAKMLFFTKTELEKRH